MSTAKKEVRFTQSQTRAVGNKLVGHAAIFNALSEDLGGFVESIKPGAFNRAIREGQDVRALFNHNSSALLGRTKSGTLRLKEDDVGLRFELELPSTQLGHDVREMVARGDLSGCSFGFVAKRDAWPAPSQRELLDLDVSDISVVTWPAYPQTDVAIREASFPFGVPEELRSHITARPSRPLPTSPPRALHESQSQASLLEKINTKLAAEGFNPGAKMKRRNQMEFMTDVEKRALSHFIITGEREVRDMQETGPAGGFVAEAFSRQVMATAKAFDPILSDEVSSVIESATGSVYDLPVLDDTANPATLIGEGGQAPETEPLSTKIQLPMAGTWDTGMVKITLSVLQDSKIDVAKVLSDAFGIRIARGFGASLLTSVFSGAVLGVTATGDPNAGSPSGMTQVGYQDLQNLVGSVDPAYRRSPKCVFLMNDNTRLSIDNLVDKEGRPILRPEYDRDGNRLLLGFRLVVSPSVPSLGTSHKPVLFGDMSKFVVRIVAGGSELLRFSERFMDTLSVGFKTFVRGNGVLLCSAGTVAPVKYLQNSAT